MMRGVKCNTPPLPTYDELLHQLVDLKSRIAALEKVAEAARKANDHYQNDATIQSFESLMKDLDAALSAKGEKG